MCEKYDCDLETQATTWIQEQIENCLKDEISPLILMLGMDFKELLTKAFTDYDGKNKIIGLGVIEYSKNFPIYQLIAEELEKWFGKIVRAGDNVSGNINEVAKAFDEIFDLIECLEEYKSYPSFDEAYNQDLANMSQKLIIKMCDIFSIVKKNTRAGEDAKFVISIDIAYIKFTHKLITQLQKIRNKDLVIVISCTLSRNEVLPVFLASTNTKELLQTGEDFLKFFSFKNTYQARY